MYCTININNYWSINNAWFYFYICCFFNVVLMKRLTYAHHSLIQGNRSGALDGLVATVLLALVFTGLNISSVGL
ncbi:putative cytochrome c oxidase subunit [Botrytis fragariae]|uniref:Putative cytochrome c oxidase subunit n=1 Tax=Botrytis fragariae TaxID=1964551 RepID=A0A8H6AJI6_9HELO|nr:putative cytochrome c oxidase subunit [Botrytis fragariae]KAF5868393.1 putative cytochrome c oxidase subunit [Botrytis fragariae]